MDPASLIGLLIALVMMTVAVVMSGGSFVSFWDTAAALMVFGGTLGAMMMCFSLRNVLNLPRVLGKVFFNRPVNQRELIDTMVKLSEIARKEGLLALESRLPGINNPFIRLGVQMAVDGTRPEVIEDVLKTDIDAVAMRHRDGKGMIDQIGRFGPAFGMIGTLLGLIIMLGNMSDPATIGSGMAVALITTLYGAVLSNAMFLPFSEKLASITKNEMIGREIILRGVMAIQSGENPRVVEQKLSTFLPPALRKASYQPMLAEEPPPPQRVPEWFVSFADMMALLLTFFIMLVSFSDPKKDDKFNALVQQLQRQFGKDLSQLDLSPGGVLARQASIARGLSAGRAQRRHALTSIYANGNPGDTPQVRTIRPGGQTAVGTVVFFEEGSDQLTALARTQINSLKVGFAGKPQKIEVRGHTASRERFAGSDYEDHWELAYKRSRIVMRYLVEELQIDPLRVRLSVAGPGEPMHLGVDAAKMRENPRVELYLLEEVVSDLHGTPAERQLQFTAPTDTTP